MLNVNRVRENNVIECNRKGGKYVRAGKKWLKLILALVMQLRMLSKVASIPQKP
jgi:hypothetical protein